DVLSEVRAWFARHVPADWQQLPSTATTDDYVAFQRWWLQELRVGGYAAPHWPAERGGDRSSTPPPPPPSHPRPPRPPGAFPSNGQEGRGGRGQSPCAEGPCRRGRPGNLPASAQ